MHGSSPSTVVAREELLETVAGYYREKLAEHGPVPAGVDWNGPASQVLRFRELMRVAEGDEGYTIADLGCGYGALLGHLREHGVPFGHYRGLDIEDSMIAVANEQHAAEEDATFIHAPQQVMASDYTVASGIFNVKGDVDDETWLSHVLHTIDGMAAMSTKGFAFNILTSWSDAEYMRENLYYADPAVLFAHCKRHHSRHVALLHDYGLYEFTIIVRMQDPVV